MRVLVTGASSQIGIYLLPRLVASGYEVMATSRHRQGYHHGVNWVPADVAVAGFMPPIADVLIHVAPLRLLAEYLPRFLARGGQRVICFGTTSRYSKAISSDPAELAFAREQADAEARVAEICAAAGAAWTIFRPTLIYGAGIDRNVAFIARMIRRFGFFPLFGAGLGRRQPVHADDLAKACLDVIDQARSFNKAYDLTGGEMLTYREMVERVFFVEGRRPRFAHVPLLVFRWAMWFVSRIPRFKDFNSEMAKRMNEDLVFDSSMAKADFGYSPRQFEPGTTK